MKTTYLSLLATGLLVCSSGQIQGQCPADTFTISGTVCAGQPIVLNRTGAGISSSWDFCSGDFGTVPTQINNATTLTGPRSMDPVFDGTDWYAFVVNYGNNTIGRFNFGSSLDSTPIYTNIGNPGNFLSGLLSNNMSFIQQGGNWYGFVSDYSTNYLIKLNFGVSLNNDTPSASIITNPLAFTGGQFQSLVQDSGKVFLFVANGPNPIVTRYAFGPSVDSIPVIDTIQMPGGSQTINCIKLVKVCDQWFGFGASYGGNNLIRLDFGTSLHNSPSMTDYGNINFYFSNPISFDIAYDGGKWYGFIQNFGLGTVLIDFGNDFRNSVSTFQTSLAVNTAGNYVSVIESGSEHRVFVAAISTNTFSQLKYESPCSASTPVSSLLNPGGISYTNAGNYKISLITTEADGNIRYYTDSITVREMPDARIGFQYTCFGQTTQFLDSSIIANDVITSWYWDFGNGDTSGLQNPVYHFSTVGSAAVSLMVTSSYGCSDTQNTNVDIHPLPVADFTASPGCSESPVDFQDQSTIASGSILGWNWQFGNGDSSLFQNPQYPYSSGGNYLVVLTVTSDVGCVDTFSTNLLVNDKPASSIDAGNTCVGQTVQFIASATVQGASITSVDWDFGDGFNGTGFNTSHLYAGGVDTFPVQLVVTASNGCVDTTNQTVKINNIPVADFSFSPITVCVGNDVQFTDLSVVGGDTISGWFWDFGNSEYDTVQHPVHQFNTAGSNTVRLTAYSPSRCPSSVYLQSVNVIASPLAGFSHSDVCFGISTQFTDLSVPSGGDPISTRSWKFGTGDSSAMMNPNYLYPAAGYYPVILFVTSNLGCTDADTLSVPVYAQPQAAFISSIPCSGQSVLFTSTSQADSASSLSAFSWNFGDFGSGAANFSTNQNPSHTYNATGDYFVFLIATTNFGCVDTLMDTVTVRPASVVQFTYSPTCFGDLMSFFNPGTFMDSSYLWNFGDNQVNQLQEPAHYYAFPGTYNVTLAVTAFGGCVTSASKQVTVSPIPIANFTVSPICKNTAYTFSDTSSITNGSITQWLWNIAGVSALDSIRNPTYTFSDTGSYSVTHVVQSDIGCRNSITKNVRVYPLPVANFSFFPQFGSPPLDVQFQDYSQGGSSYLWDFGDGSPLNSQHQPLHTYPDTGQFNIFQYVTSANGCQDTASKIIYVIKPLLDAAVTGDSSYTDGNYFYVVARIANFGTREIDSLKIEARLEDGTTIQEKYSNLLPNGANGIQWYYFHAAFYMSSQTKLNYYCVEVLDPNGQADDVPSNNERCFNKTGNLFFVNPYPNPLTGPVSLRLIIPFQDDLRIELFDQLGKKTREIFNGTANKGFLDIHENFSDLSDGIYTVRVAFRDEVQVRMIVKNSESR